MPSLPPIPESLSEFAPPKPSLSVPRPPLPSLPASLPRPRSLLAALRPSRETVDLALAVGALGTGAGIVATAAYTATNAVLPLALLSGVLSGIRERLIP